MCFAKYIIEYMSQSLAGFMLMDVPRHLAACLELYVAQGGARKALHIPSPPTSASPPTIFVTLGRDCVNCSVVHHGVHTFGLESGPVFPPHTFC